MGCSDTPKEKLNAEIVALQSNVIECFKQGSIRTTLKAENGHVTQLCGVYGQIGDSLSVFWQEGKGITLN